MKIDYVLAVPEDAPKIKCAMTEIHAQMGEKSWFYADEEEMILECIKERGFALKAMAGDEMAGFFVAYYPGERQENLGHNIGLSQEELRKVAHMEIAMVYPRFRGQGIQRQLMEESEKILRKTSYVHLMATVHPDNRFSGNNLIRLGYQVVAEARKYGGLPRLIFYKRLESEES